MWYSFFVARFSRGDFVCVVLIDAVIIAVIVLVLLKEGIFLVIEPVFVGWVLFSRECVLIKEPVVALGLFGNVVRFSLKIVIVLWAMIILRIHLRLVLEIGPIHTVHGRSCSTRAIARSQIVARTRGGTV